MNEPITLGQLWLAIALPAFFALTSTSVALVGLMMNNSRFNSIDERLLRIDTSLADARERLAKVEERLDIRSVKP